MKIIARIHTDFPDKFGIPRQSGLVEGLEGKIIFEPEFRNPEAVRGLEVFSHIWLLWQFSENKKEHWDATVRPPRLGGNTRLGVFATRSPFRPNDIGLSCVRLKGIKVDERLGAVLTVQGADLMDGTPIYDIKPYIPYTDSHPEASEGYTRETQIHELRVEFPKELLERFPAEKRRAVLGILAQDPRPAYIRDSQRIYGVSFAGFNVRFRVEEDVLTVCEVTEMQIPNQDICEQFEFRNIRSEEGEQAAEIERICFPPNEACSRERMLERVAKAPELFLVAVDKCTGKIAGFLNGLSTDEDSFRDEFFTDANLYNPDGKNIMLLGLDVLPEYRNRGLARELMRRYLQRERENGRRTILLTCLQPKVEMYQKMGFRDEGIANSVWGGSQWHEMSCVLE